VTTAQGRDGYFYPGFMEDWSAQGYVNPWEPGFRPGYGRGVAWFFPWYFLYEGHELALHPEVSEDDLWSGLDDVERDLREKIVTQWEREGFPPQEALSRAARQLNWRRAMIHGYKPGWPIGPFTETPLSSEVFSMEYPAAVDEAFSAFSGRTIADPAVMESLRAGLRPPKLSGHVYPELADPVIPASRGASAFIWKFPQEVPQESDIWIAFDPSEGVAGGAGMSYAAAASASGEDLAIDRTWGVIFERTPDGRFEQLAEYRSQETLDVTAAALHALAAWYARGRDDPPMVCGEIQFGKTALNWFLAKGWPRGRLAPRRGGSRARGEFWFSAASVRDKLLSGHALFTRLRTGRIVIRSEELWKEARFYTEGPDGVFRALNKGRGGEASKDDGMTALAILAWLDEQLYGATLLETLESGADEGDDEALLPCGPAWSGKNIGPLMKMLIDRGGAPEDDFAGGEGSAFDPSTPSFIGPF